MKLSPIFRGGGERRRIVRNQNPILYLNQHGLISVLVPPATDNRVIITKRSCPQVGFAVEPASGHSIEVLSDVSHHFGINDAPGNSVVERVVG